MTRGYQQLMPKKQPTVNGKPLKLKKGQYLAVDSDAFAKDPDASEFREMANIAMVRELERQKKRRKN